MLQCYNTWLHATSNTVRCWFIWMIAIRLISRWLLFDWFNDIFTWRDHQPAFGTSFDQDGCGNFFSWDQIFTLIQISIKHLFILSDDLFLHFHPAIRRMITTYIAPPELKINQAIFTSFYLNLEIFGLRSLLPSRVQISPNKVGRGCVGNFYLCGRPPPPF